MKHLLIILSCIFFCSCAIVNPANNHKTYYTYGNDKHKVHETTMPDTCRQSKLIVVNWRWKKGADTNKTIIVKN